MSEVPPDQPAPAQQREPTEEEVRAYLARLRRADVAEVIVQAFSVLASGAEVKLGRRDARLAIDAIAGLVDAVRGRVDAGLVEQLDGAIDKLKLGQVDAERELAKLRAEGRLPDSEDGDLADEPAQAGPAAQRPPAGERPAASRLWVPGR